tara:strand:- start:5416 stop:5904 length:489 start_codon:yes stop_codon:yes gene_type:complete
MSENDNNNKCVICLDYISENQDTYNLQCDHKYHTKCIVEWFRNGARSCPLCNDIPNSTSGVFSYGFYSNTDLYQQRLKNIKKISNKKDSPLQIKKDFNKLLTLKKDAKDTEDLLKQFRKSSDYKNIIKTERELRKKFCQKRRKIRKQENKIISSYPLLVSYQ